MNNQHLLSVIVPIYNAESSLQKCIESIVNQEYKNLQIILIDDGSTDCSGKICDEYARLDARIDVVHQGNGGSVSARKTGLVLAKGQYIGFVDADDHIETDYYSNMVAIMNEKNVDFVHSGYVIEKGASSEICIQYKAGLYDVSHAQAEFIREYIFKTNNGLHMPHTLWSKLFKADLVKGCFMQLQDSQERGEDLICICMCVLKSNHIYLDAAAGYHYIVRENSITHKAAIENVIDYGSVYKMLINVFSNCGKLEIVQRELGHYFKDFFINFFAFQLKADNILLYKYADINSLKGKKVVLYCAGKVGQDYYTQLSKYENISIVAWVDKQPSKYKFDYREVVGIDMLSNYDFDILLIAVLSKSLANEIKCGLVEEGIQENKIVWKQPARIAAE